MAMTHISLRYRVLRLLFQVCVVSVSAMMVAPNAHTAPVPVWRLILATPDRRVLDVAVDPQDSALIYAGTDGAGVFKSSDRGVTWRLVNSGLTSTNLQVFSIDPVATEVLHAATLAGGAFLTRSAAEIVQGVPAWNAVNDGLSALNVLALTADPLNPQTLYAGTHSGGVFKTDSSGIALGGGPGWIAALPGLSIQALAVDPLSPTRVYAGTPAAGIWRSDDGGATWKALNSGLTSLNVRSIAIDPLHPATLYTGTTAGGIFRTDSFGEPDAGGVGWRPVNTGLASLNVATLAVNPVSPNVLYAGTLGSGVYRTDTRGEPDAANGAAWKPMVDGLGSLNVFKLTLDPQLPSRLYAGTIGGLYVLSDISDPPAAVLQAALLPASRSVRVGEVASVFASIVNSGDETALQCIIAPDQPVAARFSFLTTDPRNKRINGPPNVPVNIGPRETQSFVLALTPTRNMAPTLIHFRYDCLNTAPAQQVANVNSLLLSASAAATPDIIGFPITPSQDGILRLSGVGAASAFAVATTNVGSAGLINARAVPSDPSLPLVASICETVPATGVCKQNPPTASLSLAIAENATPSFGIFVTATGTIPFDPAGARIDVRFQDHDATLRGATSVAVTTQPTAAR